MRTSQLVLVVLALFSLSACNEDAPQAGPVKQHVAIAMNKASHSGLAPDGPIPDGLIPDRPTADGILPSTPDFYLAQAQSVQQALDRPWAPAEGRLGNLRHVQITARNCVVRVVSGSENRVFPGSQPVLVVEKSRVLDADPNEQPVPRDVVLAPDRAQSCPSMGSCGLSITPVTASSIQAPGAVCFTLQLASGHNMLVGGDDLTLLIDRLHQPVLRLSINPSDRLRVWLDQVELGLLAISTNAASHVGGSGTLDFLTAVSSNSASVTYLHEFHARHIGISTTTINTRWSIRIDPSTLKSVYYQPARAPGKIAELYSIEIDGPLKRLEAPAGSVLPLALNPATRTKANALRDDVLDRAGPGPKLSASDTALSSATELAATLPRDPRQQVADVVRRYLPASIQITAVALWNDGGRIEGTAPDAATAAQIVAQLENSGEFTFVSGGKGNEKGGVYVFSTQVGFSCVEPSAPSICPAGDPATPGAYSKRQVRAALESLLGPTVVVQNIFLNGAAIKLEAQAASEAQARAALLRIRSGLFHTSTSGYGPAKNDGATEINATLKLICAVPPKPGGICTSTSAAR